MNEIITTPLGTISPYTKGNRNCPGFLIEYNNQKILLDCGNSVYELRKYFISKIKYQGCLIDTYDKRTGKIYIKKLLDIDIQKNSKEY